MAVNGECCQTFTSAGGARVWETFSLSQEAGVRFLSIVAVEGPDDYPALRVSDLKVIGDIVSTGVNYVSVGHHLCASSTMAGAR